MVGRDTPEPIRSGRPCKTSHGAGCGQRTENPPALAVGSVKDRPALIYAFFCNRRTFDEKSAFFAKIVRAYILLNMVYYNYCFFLFLKAITVSMYSLNRIDI